MARHLVLFCMLMLGVACASVGAAAQTLLLEGARVIPGDGSPAVENAALLVENGMISRLGYAGEIIAPPGALRLDMSGKTIMPTLVSTHVHPGFQRGVSYSADNFTRETVLEDMSRALYFGVSAMMSLGIEKGEILDQIRADLQSGQIVGPRLLIAGRGIGAPNAGPGAAAFAHIAYEITTAEEARRAVEELAGRHVDTVKIWVDDRGGRAPRLSIPLSRIIIDQAHRAGLKVTAHIFYHEDAVALAAAGINAFAHLVRDQVMSDELIASMLEHHVYAMPNLGAPERATHASVPASFDEPYLLTMLRDTEPPELVARMRSGFAARTVATAERNRSNYAILQTSLAKLAAANVSIVLGCDTGLEDHVFGYAEQRELELMVEAGMTPAQVIVAATSRAAEFLGLVDTGTLAPGKRADLLVLDANPLDDIRNTRRIARMYLAGAEVDRAGLKASLAHTDPSARAE
jgi:imidazolonepropionase-like amidohydrolase